MLPSLGLLTTATHTVCRVTTLATPLSILAVEGNTYCNHADREPLGTGCFQPSTLFSCKLFIAPST